MMTQEQTNEMIRAAVARRKLWVQCRIAQFHAALSDFEAQLLQIERQIQADRELRTRVAKLWGPHSC